MSRGSRQDAVRVDCSDAYGTLTYSDVINFAKRVGVSDDLTCVQQVKATDFVLSFSNSDVKETLLSLEEVYIGDYRVYLSDVDARYESVKLLYLPYEVSPGDVISALRPFGVVSGIRDVPYAEFAAISTGTRIVQMLVQQAIPSYVVIKGHQVKVLYRGQVATCRRCAQPGHFARDCPMVTCFRCRKPGHRAVNCSVPVTCSRCGKSGHTAWGCKGSRPEQSGMVSDDSDVQDDDIPEDVEQETPNEERSTSEQDWNDRVEQETSNEERRADEEREARRSDEERLRMRKNLKWVSKASVRIHHSWSANATFIRNSGKDGVVAVCESGLKIHSVNKLLFSLLIIDTPEFLDRLKVPYSSQYKINYD